MIVFVKNNKKNKNLENNLMIIINGNGWYTLIILSLSLNSELLVQ